ncbi:Serine carboxypeptidases (lysosomal cathepsin A) [Ceraceosorus bombacis]|uniref:Carboxypeptidase n=1 Tax=Ceraceosorus bombacis TaxID=401625 RepID=A0A0P1BPF4_9BASI|nr:Serine carboxypeptidases (lysosomal cathepsin A) [Ceraceosorus bombacis]
MRSSYLSLTSAAVVCAAALARQVSGAVTPPLDSLRGPAEELQVDAMGGMHWASEKLEQAKQAVGASPKPLSRPSFEDLNVPELEEQARPVTEWLKEQLIEAQSSTEQGAEMLFDEIHQQIEHAKHKVENAFKNAKHDAQGWISKGLVSVQGTRYERLVHQQFPRYSLRISQTPLDHCDSDVKSFAGYLDIDADKHLWFAFFESRSDPAKDPVTLWLNGGPGCSSSTGWLMEGVGPCTIDKNGTDTKYNKHSWTSKSSVFFLDQPVNVGFSYSEGGGVSSTPQAADDVYAFLSLFFARYPQYSNQPFSIAAESYGGRYAPLYAAKINEENKKLARSRFANPDTIATKVINLESILLGNGLTEPQTQFETVPEYACKGEYAIFKGNSEVCDKLESKAKTCSSLIGSCYKSNSRLACLPAALYCWSGLYGDMQNAGVNPYDVRKKCDRSEDKDGPLCYRDESYVQAFMNLDSTKKAFSVPQDIKFEACNMEVNQAFMFQGDGMHNSAAVIPGLIEDGVRVLVYAGVADYMCNYIGNVGHSAWGLKLDTPFKDELNAAKQQEWKVDGKVAGAVRQAGKGAGTFTLVEVKGAGHMVPYDQPLAAQVLIEKWLANESLI